MENMTIESAKEICKQYDDADKAFRAAKKDRYVKYAKVSELKAKRDALAAPLDAALKFLKDNNAL